MHGGVTSVWPLKITLIPCDHCQLSAPAPPPPPPPGGYMVRAGGGGGRSIQPRWLDPPPKKSAPLTGSQNPTETDPRPRR